MDFSKFCEKIRLFSETSIVFQVRSENKRYPRLSLTVTQGSATTLEILIKHKIK